jgi:alanine dehydrogenase
MVKLMEAGSVIVDVSIDQGGCFETSHPTTHSEPTFVVDGVTHYCVTNMPGAVPITSTYALTNATMPYVTRLADSGPDALRADPGFLAGLSIIAGNVTSASVAEGVNADYTDPREALASQRRRTVSTGLVRD